MRAGARSRVWLGVVCALVVVGVLSAGSAAGGSWSETQVVLSAGPVSQSSLTLLWQALPDAVAVDRYDVLLDGVKVGESTLGVPGLPLPVGVLVPSWTFSGLGCGTSHVLGLQGVDDHGRRWKPVTLGPVQTGACPAAVTQSPPSPIDSQPPAQPADPLPAAQAAPSDTEPPAKPLLSLGPATQTSLVLNWLPDTDNVGVDHYDVFLNGSRVAQTSGLSWTFTGLSCGTSYALGLVAFDAAGNHSLLAEATWSPVTTQACAAQPPPTQPPPTQPPPAKPAPPPDTEPPAKPLLSLGPATQTSLVLNWLPDTDDVGIDHYDVFLNGSRVAQTDGLTWTYTGLSCGTSYALGLVAFDAAGNHSLLTEATWSPVSTLACASGDSSPPSAPTGLSVSARTSTSVSLAWSASTDNVGVAGYGVYNGSVRVTNVPGLSYTVSGLSCGTAYTLAVDAYDAAGNRSAPSQLTASTSPCAGPPPVVLQPGQSLDAAYDAAVCGAVIQPASGSWSQQIVTGGKTCAAGNYVTFEPAPGASPSISELDNAASRVEYSGLKISRFYNDGAGIRWGNGQQDGVIFRNIDADTFCISGGNNIQILGGDIGPSLSNSANGQQQPCVAKFPAQTSPAPNNVLIQGALFHDHNAADGAHAECLQLGGDQSLVIRGNTWRNCASTASLHITRYDDSVPSANVTIENNFFESNAGASTVPLGNIQYDRAEPGLVIRYNSFFGSGGYAILATFDSRTPISPDALIYGNAANAPGHSQPDNYAPCDSHAVYHDNVWNGASCSSSDLNANPLFTSPLDLHLQAGSPAVDNGDPSSFPTTDIDGQLRPIGPAPDAGADER
jgi:chitodextrinase